MLILKNNRPDFKSLFVEHLKKVCISYSSHNPYCYGYEDWGYDDDDYYSDLFHDYDDYYDGTLNDYRNSFSVSGGRKRKRGSRGGSNKKLSTKRSKYLSVFGHGANDDDDDIVYPLKGKNKSKCKSSSSKHVRYSDNIDNLFSKSDDDKMIYYYSDMNNPDDNVSIFYSVFDFDKFLDEEGIYVNESDIQSLLSRSISHCCINPNICGSRLELMTDSSFGGLHYQYAENNDELLEAEDRLVHSSSVNR